MLPQLRALHARGCRWGVILSSGGHFAAAVVETRVTPKARGFSDILTVLAHKTYHRYVVRAKAGGRQSNKDATGKYAKSAGSQLRRHNEVDRLFGAVLLASTTRCAVVLCTITLLLCHNSGVIDDNRQPWSVTFRRPWESGNRCCAMPT